MLVSFASSFPLAFTSSAPAAISIRVCVDVPVRLSVPAETVRLPPPMVPETSTSPLTVVFADSLPAMVPDESVAPLVAVSVPLPVSTPDDWIYLETVSESSMISTLLFLTSALLTKLPPDNETKPSWMISAFVVTLPPIASKPVPLLVNVPPKLEMVELMKSGTLTTVMDAMPLNDSGGTPVIVTGATVSE